MLRAALAVGLSLVMVGCTLVSASAQAPSPWLPQQSWPGGGLYDARLDKSVLAWHAGVPLADLFADLQRQTDVALAFYPARDDNARLCVNVFLNPKSPPTLRDVLAQLSWVTDCTFGYAGEGTARTYYLLSTSIKDGAAARLQKAVQESREHGDPSYEREKAARKAQLPARWESYRAAFSLSREQAISRYRGTDDYLLLALLDPPRRALGECLAALSPEDLAAILRGETLRRAWGQWTPEQQRLLLRALGPLPEGTPGYPPPADLLPSAWTNDSPVTIVLSANEYGPFALARTTATAQNPTSGLVGRAVLEGLLATAGLHLLPDDQAWLPDDTMALRRALGEPEGDREELTQEFEAKQEVWMRQRQARQWRERLHERCRFSEDVRAHLSELSSPVDATGSYALWQVQEAVAAQSGLNVLSDAFWQPPRSLADSAAFFCLPEHKEFSLLSALCLLVAGRETEYRLQYNVEGSHEPSVAWEMEGSSTFLRFRSAARDVWRAAVLPPDLLADLDRAVESAPATAHPEVGEGVVHIVADLPAMSRLALRLNVFQTRFGGSLLYRDPTDHEEARRRALREAALVPLAHGDWMFGWLGTLTDAQWSRLRTEGLRWGHDLGPDQRGSDFLLRDLKRRVPEDRMNDLVVKLSSEDRPFGGPEWVNSYLVTFSLDGKKVLSGVLGRTVQAQPTVPKHLVTPPAP